LTKIKQVTSVPCAYRVLYCQPNRVVLFAAGHKSGQNICMYIV